MKPLTAEQEEELRQIRVEAKRRHEKARKAALRRGREDFPLLPFECSWAYELKFIRGLTRK